MWYMAYRFPCAAFFSMTVSLNEDMSARPGEEHGTWKSGFFFMCTHARRVPSKSLTSSGLAAFAREKLARIRQRLLSRRLQAKGRLRTLTFHVMCVEERLALSMVLHGHQSRPY